MSLVKRAAAAPAATPKPAAGARAGAAGARAGGFKFNYKARTAEDVKERARQTSGRDSYISSEVPFFTAAAGPNTVRILPPPPDADWRHYGYRVWEHRDIGVDKGAYLCLDKMKGEPCPVCEERARATAAGEKDFAWSLRPQNKTLIYIVDRKAESKGPMLWNITAGGKRSWDTDLLNLCIDPADGSVLLVDDPENGFDLSFVREGVGLDTKYNGKQFSRRPSPLSDSSETMEKWLRFIMSKRLDLDAAEGGVLVWHDYDYIKHALEGQAAPESHGSSGEEGAGAQQEPKAAAEPAPRLQRRGAAPAQAQPPKEPDPPAAAAGTEELSGPVEGAPTWEELKEMDEDTLGKLVEVFQLDPPADGFEATGEDGNDALREWIAGQLGVEVPEPAPAPAAAAPAGSWKDRLAKMQGK